MATGKSPPYDVVILGGGLAGLTLAIQLKQTLPRLSILVLERRKDNAPPATHKVGESTSELAASYLREVLGLDEYLDEHQLLKFGLRFFFSPEYNNHISRRVEVGTRDNNFYPTHQLDRGLLENELMKRAKGLGADVFLGCHVKDVKISEAEHTVYFERDGVEIDSSAKWIVDSTGRSGLLKRKFDLKKEINHTINAAWFRLDSEIDIDDWSDNMEWRGHVAPGLRRLATNHLMGEGYWVWLIPLVSGNTSIGIVADPVFHPFENFNTYEKAMNWLKKYEPLAAKMLEKHKRLDFKVMKNFAYDAKQFFSADRWAITGEAGAFMDPFYSPGSDFIALSNNWITDLIVRDVKGENILLRIMIYELAQKELLTGWVQLYRNMYGVFGKSQIMIMKIVWDWSTYWAIPCVLFMNNGYTNIFVLKQYSSSNIGKRFGKLNEQMQSLFQVWAKHDTKAYSDFCGNLFDLQFLRKLQDDLTLRYQPEELIQKVTTNLEVLEKISAEIFRRVSADVNGTPPDMLVDPYDMSIEDSRETLMNKSKNENALSVDDQIKEDIEKMVLMAVETKLNN